MTPTTTGIYSLRLPSGRVVRRRVKSMNDELFAIIPGGIFGLLASLVPLDLVEGEWVE